MMTPATYQKTDCFHALQYERRINATSYSPDAEYAFGEAFQMLAPCPADAPAHDLASTRS
jgi:hypothetical protein